MDTYMRDIPVVFDQGVVDQIIESADFGGIGYWAHSTSTVGTEYAVLEDETNEWHKVTFEELADALVAVATGKAGVRSDIQEYALRAIMENDGGDVDAEVADVTVQFAIFGEIIYG